MIKIHVLYSQSNYKLRPFARVIDWVEKVPGNVTHVSIGIEYGSDFLIWEAHAPRPRFVDWKTWRKLNDPKFIFTKEIKNQVQMFNMIQYLAVEASQAFYSYLQLVLIFLKRLLPRFKKQFEGVILNDYRGLVCSEGVMRFLVKFFPDQFQYRQSYDDLGLRESFQQVSDTWPMMNIELTQALVVVLDGRYK